MVVVMGEEVGVVVRMILVVIGIAVERLLVLVVPVVLVVTVVV